MQVRSGGRIVLPLAVVIGALPCMRAAAQETRHRTVLTIHQGSASYPVNPLLDEGIRHALTSRPDLKIDYFAEYLESERFSEERLFAPFADYLREKYRGRRIDVVIAITDAARRFASDHLATLFPDAPIVAAVGRPPGDAILREGAGMTGIAVAVAYGETLNLALRLHPSTQDVFVVARTDDERIMALVRSELQPFSSRVRLTYINEDTVPGMLARVKAVPSRSVILYIWQSQDEPGRLLYPDQVARLVASASPVPVYGSSELYVGTGVTGGVVRTNGQSGRRLGEIAVRILDGTAARDIPFESAQLTPTFDWRAMKRWGLDESQLPPGSLVSFRDPTIWRDYRREVLTGLVVLALQSLLIVALLYQRRARRKAESESQNSLVLAADANRRVTMSALTASIAHELSQPLSTILLNAQAGEMLIDSNRATLDMVRTILSEIRRADVRATEIVDRHRKMLRTRQLEKQLVDIHSVVRESLDLVAHDTGANQVEFDLDLETAPCVVSGDPVLLQQVLVNLVMNAMQAMATTSGARRRVTVLSRATEQGVEVSVRDRGTGLPSHMDGRLFEPFVTGKTNGMGIGLTIARFIAEAHGGTIEAHNNPEGGATFTLTLPCVEASQDHQLPGAFSTSSVAQVIDDAQPARGRSWDLP